MVDEGRSNGKRPLSWSWSVSQERKCREKRERERAIFLRVHGKPIRPLHRACTAHEGTGHALEEVLTARAEEWAWQVSMLQRAGGGE